MLSDQQAARNAYPQSPAEQYISTRLRWIDEISASQANNNVGDSSGPSLSPLTTSSVDPFPSLGCDIPTSIIVTPPSDSTARSETHRTSHLTRPDNQRSLPRSIAPSNQSTADYPAAGGSSVITLSIPPRQMSHEQRMQGWHQRETAKIQKKRRCYYTYDSPSQTAPTDRIRTAMLLTPHAPSPSTPTGASTTRRAPTMSPFAPQTVTLSTNTTVSSAPHEHSLASVDTKSNMIDATDRCPTPPKRMDCSDTDSSATSTRSQQADTKSSESD